MDDPVPFGGPVYLLMVCLLVFARGMDFLSTWLATPHLVLEGNPLAKKLGWKWGVVVNTALIVLLGFWPLSAVVVATASVLVAARNFQSAWLMRSLGEEFYRDWYGQRVRETPVLLFLSCLAGNTLLTAAVGLAIIYFSGPNYFSEPNWVLLGIGMGIVAYAIAVAFYTLLAIWRMRRAANRQARQLKEIENTFANGPVAELWPDESNQSPNQFN